MKKSVCILDYGSGNVRSVFNIVSLLNPEVIVSNLAEDIRNASHLILPGVGAFEAAMQKIKNSIPLEVLEAEVFTKKKPFLGICVGMQVLADTGYEFGKHKGLGWITGEVKKINSGSLPLPHIGWNNTEIKKDNPLVEGISSDFDFYFVHSFAFFTDQTENVVATTDYGQKFCSIIAKENVYGVQFHPEKSQKAGQLLLENFLKI